MSNESELYRAAASRRETSAHDPRMAHDPGLEAAGAMRGAAVAHSTAVKGADAHLDTALRDLMELERQATGEYVTVLGLEDAARNGRLPADTATARARDVGDEAGRRYAAAVQAAERALTAAREATIRELLPEPAPDTAAVVKRDELGRLLTAAKVSSSPAAAFEAVYRDRAKNADRAGIANLLSGWGRAAFLEAGGTDERWAELRTTLALRAAEGPLKESPTATKLRKLHGSEATRAVQAAQGAAGFAVKRLTDRGQR